MFSLRMVALRMSAKLRLEYLKALFALPVSVIDTLPSGQASNTLTNTANVLQIGIGEKAGAILQWMATVIAAIVIAFKYSWSLTLVTSSVIIFVGLIYGCIIPINIKLTKEVEHADEKVCSSLFRCISRVKELTSRTGIFHCWRGTGPGTYGRSLRG
jgi:ATP-binding cassette subfamily B (MDR/TAP) protein 1